MLLKFVEILHKIVSFIHSKLFNQIQNKKIILDLFFFEFTQNFLVKIYNRLNLQPNPPSKLTYDYKNIKFIIRDKTLFQIAKSIVDYKIIHNININDYIKELDKKSKITIHTIMERIYYYYTHTLMDLKKFFDLEDLKEKRNVDQFIENFKKDFKLPIERYDPSVIYYQCGLKFIPARIKKGLMNKVFLDGGAFTGDSSLIFEKYYNPKKIFAFEPDFKNNKYIKKTIELNDLKKVIPVQSGLSDKPEILKFKSSGGTSHICNNGQFKVKVITIDDFVVENRIDIGLIKLDIEGFDLKALKGAEKTLKKFKPVLLVSIYHNGEQFFETINYIKNLNLNYKFIIRKLDPSHIYIETLLIAWYEDK